MFDLCEGEPKALQYEDIAVTAFKQYPEDFQLRGDPEFKAAEKEIKVNWLTAKG